VLISAVAASFGGTSLLAWYPVLWARRTAGTSPDADVPLGVPRSVGWLVAAAIVLTLFVGVLGPGIRFGAAGRLGARARRARSEEPALIRASASACGGWCAPPA
jgi:hypothetical protein